MTEILFAAHTEPRCCFFEGKKKKQRHGVGEASSDWIIMASVVLDSVLGPLCLAQGTCHPKVSFLSVVSETRVEDLGP